MNTIKLFKEFFLSDARRYLDDEQFAKLNRGGVNRCYSMSQGYPGLRFSFWMRLCSTLRGNRCWLPLYAYALRRYKHYMYKYGMSIPFVTKIGRGFYIGHFGCIVVSPHSEIGNNVNISQGVTIGGTYRGDKAGYPVIGDEVYIGPGAKIIGAIHIGNNVAIGANAVVTHDVPDNSVVGGVPARVISMKGAQEYISRKSEML